MAGTCACLLLLLFATIPHLNVDHERVGQVYRAFNNLQGDNESVSSVSTDGGIDLASSQPQHQHRSDNAPHSAATASTNASQSNSNRPSTPAIDRASNPSSRRDDDGNVEFEFD